VSFWVRPKIFFKKKKNFFFFFFEKKKNFYTFLVKKKKNETFISYNHGILSNEVIPQIKSLM
jgi:predicted transcriptional regulator